MVDEDIAAMYTQILEYVSSKQMYYSDPSISDGEFSDVMDQDMTSLIDLIQRQIKKIPTIGESATIKSYRDFNSARSEYSMRLKSRSDYWEDASKEEAINIDKWTYNKKLAALQMGGRRTES